MKSFNFNERKIIQSLIIFCSAVVILLSVFGDKGYLELHKLISKEKQIEAEIEHLKKEKQDWLSKTHSIKNNQTYLQRVDKYGNKTTNNCKNYGKNKILKFSHDNTI